MSKRIQRMGHLASEARDALEATKRALAAGDVETAHQILLAGGPQLLELAEALGYDEIAELQELLDPQSDDESPLAAPAALTLTPIELDLFNPFQNASTIDSWVETIVENGFLPCGAFVADQLPLAMQAFFKAPATYGIVSQFGGQVSWSEFVTYFADGSTEVWSNVPVHDGKSPPWNAIHQDPDASVAKLIEAAENAAHVKQLASIKGEEFRQRFCEDYQRSMQWRSENQ